MEEGGPGREGIKGPRGTTEETPPCICEWYPTGCSDDRGQQHSNGIEPLGHLPPLWVAEQLLTRKQSHNNTGPAWFPDFRQRMQSSPKLHRSQTPELVTLAIRRMAKL